MAKLAFELDAILNFKYPSDSDLRRLLRFEPDSGAIWLGERRMVLMHTSGLAALRQDLMDSVGPEHARRILTRMGYASGLSDAEYTKKMRPGETLRDSDDPIAGTSALRSALEYDPLALDAIPSTKGSL